MATKVHHKKELGIKALKFVELDWTQISISITIFNVSSIGNGPEMQKKILARKETRDSKNMRSLLWLLSETKQDMTKSIL